MGDKSTSVSRILEGQPISKEPESMFDLEDRELAKHRLRSLKDGYEDYVTVYRNYLQRHYLIIALSSVVILMGVIIAFLKFAGRESLLYSFKAIQSSFASLVSGGSIIAFGSSILYAEKRDAIDDSKYEPKEEAIKLCMEKDLEEILYDTINKLRKKKGELEIVKAWQSISATTASIFVLFLVGIDFFGFLPDIPYVDIGLDGFISIVGAYFFTGACIINSILPDPKKMLPEQSFVIRYLVIIPCAFLVSLTSKSMYDIYWNGEKDFIKEVCLSSDEKEEIKYLLCGLNPGLISKSAKNFYKELNFGRLTEKTEKTPLIGKSEPTNFIKKIDQIEPKAKQVILEEYFKLGKALINHLKGQTSNDNKDQYIMNIVKKFPSTGTEKIRQHYLELKTVGRGLTLAEFFDKYPLKRKNNLLVEEINIAHDALKVYSIFNSIGSENIKLIKTFTPSSIGKFHRDAIINEIIWEFNNHSLSDVSIKIDSGH